MVGFRSLLAIWLDKGWGNPDRNVVAKTTCCWWTCGFAWWLWFPSKNHHWNILLVFELAWHRSIFNFIHIYFARCFDNETGCVKLAIQTVWRHLCNSLSSLAEKHVRWRNLFDPVLPGQARPADPVVFGSKRLRRVLREDDQWPISGYRWGKSGMVVECAVNSQWSNLICLIPTGSL